MRGIVNIGPVLAEALELAGVRSLEDLRAIGYLEAWRRVKAVDANHGCVNSCLALAGAVAGVRWMSLPPEVRARVSAEARAEGATTFGRA